MSYRITLIPGDGIGPEVTEAAVRVLEAAGVPIEWEAVVAGAGAVAEFGKPLPDQVIDSVHRNRVALKGPVTTPIGHGFTSVNVALRKALDLYVSLRRARNLPGIATPFADVDIIVVRENTEGEYSGIEHEVVSGVVESLKIITERASTRIARRAFELARREERKKVTAVHKANIMKMSDGLFLECCRRVAREFPQVGYNEIVIDNCAAQLVVNPRQFDVMVMENLYGDILSDVCAALVGGVGVVPGANLGDDIAVFEAVHGSAPDIAGKNLANPTAVIMSGVEMLDYLGEHDKARAVFQAVCRVIAKGNNLTRDLGGQAGTREMAEAVIEQLR